MMVRRPEMSVREALQDREALERAFIAAAQEVVRVHRSFNEPVWTTAADGEFKEVHVDQFEQSVNQREAELNRKYGRTPPAP